MSTQVQTSPAKRRRASADKPPERIVIQYPAPAVDDGRYPAKRCVGDIVRVEADIFRDGHEILRAVVRYRAPGSNDEQEQEMERLDAHLGGVRWATNFEVDRPGHWEYTIEAWSDVFGTWRDELGRKVAAQQHDLAGELSEGVQHLQNALKSAQNASDESLIKHAIETLGDKKIPESAKHDVALGPELFNTIERIEPRHGSTTLENPIAIEVDRERAKFGAWYELFPRSFGGLKGVEKQLPRLQELGFDVLYLPPIHPIGHTNRKGRDNSLTAGPQDPGSPWAIGDETGGHDAVHKDLGTIEDVKRLTKAAKQHGIDIALDFAIQCSADHPWLHEHPEWFHRRPDGTLKYAENPPKRYQDIYNVNWDSPDWKGLWDALLTIMLQWVDAGVTVFRVDNPHTKPFEFWRWLIENVHQHNRDVVFLAEAFTRRSVMRHLAKIGFSQSYTYFTWKNSRHELTEYVSELAHTEESEYFRPNFFANTPDILHEYLQHGGRPAFEARLTLAATLSPSYGIYSGYESFENVAVKAGSEEYLHSEKYEIKQRALDGPLLPYIQRLNAIRKENAALHDLTNVTFLDTANDALIAYAKHSPGNTIITVVSIDPHQTQEGLAIVPANLGLPPSFTAHDLLTDERYLWRIGANYVRLEPGIRQAHIVRVEI
ncbi:MAG TPA: alpha-1,4-glucan--maltose-1-phosphate maltosyltransferase [Solirubrobacteraceae bacterium]|nr:alpha-1,4-glucan--maltose-1-phosphate maltosyltransferase [Solirubrobacteraceae bacterium]